MFEWLKRYIYEINFFVAGWCAFAALDSLTEGSYLLAALNVALVYINIKLARS